jgi:uncharacterized protein (TIGR02217 family)
VAVPTFPALLGLGFPVVRSPIWSTITQTTVSGKRAPFAMWSYPRYKYNLPFNFLRNDILGNDFKALFSFFNLLQGSAGLFAYNDPDDNTAVATGAYASNFAVGNGTTTTFQIWRNFNGQYDPVFLPVSGIEFFLNGVPTFGAIGNLGVVTFSPAPGAGVTISWQGTYNWLCRFDEDTQDFEKFMSNWWRKKSFVFSTEKF